MNKKLFLLVAFVLSLGLGFTACGDDEEDDTTVDYAAKIAGTYNGVLVVDFGTQEKTEASDVEVPDTQDIKIERVAQNKIKLSVTNFVFEGMGNVGSINIETTVSENGGVVKLADTDPEGIELLGGAIKCKVALSSASVDKNDELTLKIRVTDISNFDESTIISVDFTGDKK